MRYICFTSAAAIRRFGYRSISAIFARFDRIYGAGPRSGIRHVPPAIEIKYIDMALRCTNFSGRIVPKCSTCRAPRGRRKSREISSSGHRAGGGSMRQPAAVRYRVAIKALRHRRI